MSIRYKYPRTAHLLWSETCTFNEPFVSLHFLDPKTEVVVTEKMDGENTSIGKDYAHARSLDTEYHPSRTWLANFASTWQYKLPEEIRITGENLFAVHSIKYTNLKSYFYGFGVWNEKTCLSWPETLDWFERLDIVPVPVLFEGSWFDAYQWTKDWKRNDPREGYVVRPIEAIPYKDFTSKVAKYVRPNHVQTTQHWRNGRVEKNELVV